jgi:peptide-O-fucosyltransferase
MMPLSRGLLAAFALAVLCSGEVRYLFYDMDPGEGFNFRKDVVHRAFSVARSLGKYANSASTWTLVLPAFRNRKGREEYPFSVFFDIMKLGQAYKDIDVMDANEYLERYGKQADINIFLRYNDENQGFGIGCPEEHEAGQEGYYGYEADSGPNVLNIKYAGSRMGFKKHICWNFCFENAGGRGAGSRKLAETLLDEIGRKEPYERSIFIGGFDRVLPDWEDEDGKAHERKFLTYTPMLLGEGARYMKEAALEHKQYISVHWRRADFKHHHSSHYATTEQMGQTLYELCKKRKLYVVFMATDTYGAEVDEVRKHAQKLVREDKKLCTGESSGTCPELELLTYTYDNQKAAVVLNPMQQALVEQVVASEAGFFVGTLHSTFSHEIHFQRQALGFDWDQDDGTLMASGKVEAGLRYSDE